MRFQNTYCCFRRRGHDWKCRPFVNVICHGRAKRKLLRETHRSLRRIINENPKFQTFKLFDSPIYPEPHVPTLIRPWYSGRGY